MRPRVAGDDGFTLTEVLMAMLVMSIAVAAVIEGLTTMIGLGREHRGHAVLEAATRNVSASTVAVAGGTALREATATGVLKVVDASLLPPPVPEGSYATVGTEVVKILARDTAADTVTVTRGHNGEPVTAAPAGTLVVPVLRCPTAQQLRPALAASDLPDGASVDVTSVDYWQPGGPGGSFVDRPSCLAAYEQRCPPPEVLVECGFGLFRANVAADTTDARLNGKSEQTAVLVRQGAR